MLRRAILKGYNYGYQRSVRAAAAGVEVSTKGRMNAEKIRNVAIIAHVDHGKTTLVDGLIRSGGSSVEQERVMDSHALEKERGITILAKYTSIRHNGHLINVVDTPGHSDFGGEVERIMGMVDGVVLVVDATEGPMTQTKFVLRKALQHGLRPIVVLNKMDRPTQRHADVETDLWELFHSLGASDEQMSYTTLYASGRAGWVEREAVMSPSSSEPSMIALLDTIVSEVPSPHSISGEDEAFRMLVSKLDTDAHFGRVATGRVVSGTLRPNDELRVLRPGQGSVGTVKAMRVVAADGGKTAYTEAVASGDIVGIAGLANVHVGDTLVHPSLDASSLIEPPKVDPPVISMIFSPNSSPLAGRDGGKMTARKLRERLAEELQSNVSLEIADVEDDSSAVSVRGRGEMQLGVLVENMRREGYELSVSPPQVLLHETEDGSIMEPIEELYIDVGSSYSNIVLEKMSVRRAKMLSMKDNGKEIRFVFLCPARAMIGLRNELNVSTKGTAVINHIFHSYEDYMGALDLGGKGRIVSLSAGKATAYAIEGIEPRGTLFVAPGAELYDGMIIGEHNKPGDCEVNACKAKALTNMRSTTKEEFSRLKPIMTFTLEEALAYVREDELVEVTPKNIRMRKRILNSAERQQASRRDKNQAKSKSGGK